MWWTSIECDWCGGQVLLWIGVVDKCCGGLMWWTDVVDKCCGGQVSAQSLHSHCTVTAQSLQTLRVGMFTQLKII